MNRQEHLLVCLTEECAEIIKAADKALRFGLDDGYPNTSRTNLTDLSNEINDLRGVIELLHADGVTLTVDTNKITEKKKRVEQYLQYSLQRGTLRPTVEPTVVFHNNTTSNKNSINAAELCDHVHEEE